MVTVNNFFCHCLKEINLRHYPDVVRILLTNNMVEIHQYAVQQLKHLPSKSLDDIRKTLLYEKEVAVLTSVTDRRSNTLTTPADRTDSNLVERVTDFLSLTGKKCTTEFDLGSLHP